MKTFITNNNQFIAVTDILCCYVNWEKGRKIHEKIRMTFRKMVITL
jgi:hypothetical protein